MPLPPADSKRTSKHVRAIRVEAFERDDGLWDIEARLTDTKPEPFELATGRRPAGAAVHDMWLRVTIDGDYLVHAIEASSDATPYPLCKEAEATVQSLVGERIVSGWNSKVKQRLRGAAGCTHLMEMLATIGTAAFQGINYLRRVQRNEIGSAAKVHLDSCYAYAAHRAVVRQYWPHEYRAPGPQPQPQEPQELQEATPRPGTAPR